MAANQDNCLCNPNTVDREKIKKQTKLCEIDGTYRHFLKDNNRKIERK